MFNYFYTVELNLDASTIARKTFKPLLSFLNTPLQTIEATSKEYYNERECVEALITDLDRVKALIQTNASHLSDDDMYTEAYTNPFIETPSIDIGPRHVEDGDVESEKAFWADNKLAVFALYDSDTATDFLARLIIYVYEDDLQIEKLDAATQFSISQAPTTLN